LDSIVERTKRKIFFLFQIIVNHGVLLLRDLYKMSCIASGLAILSCKIIQCLLKDEARSKGESLQVVKLKVPLCILLG
jgi:hypothetical protein